MYAAPIFICFIPSNKIYLKIFINSYAWSEAKKRFPKLTYKIKLFGEKKLPCVYDENTGYMVFTEITIDELTYTMWLPVMDNNNKAMKNKPTVFGLNPLSSSLMVGGEAGAEAIASIETLQDYISQTINENKNSLDLNMLLTKIFELLNEYLPNISKRKLIFDTGAIADELSPFIDYSLGNINALKVRRN